ncbi:unnamed protein product [Diatraea saccharalis]|uniref:Uncharacterized protein n=1 Tax=Diatraea saccharalis TaxID=40085 RepID=A0A9N9QVJ5_9NEOP|nr:unnamed protein product [Diatraea saccharalis]
MVRELPALTVLYLPESAAVQLTADCGLAGVKKVQCTGNLKREVLLRGLSCGEEDEQSSTPNTGATTSISLSIVSSDNTFTDQDTINDVTTDDAITTEHEDDINQSSTVKPTEYPYHKYPSLSETAAKQIINNVNRVLINKNIDLDSVHNNLQSNNIPKLYGNDNFLPSDLSEKLEDETHKQHKILHDEIARHGNFETIFTQPTDHFVPPLVMAKAKISDDMTVLSLEEKHAQQIAEQRYSKHIHEDSFASESQVMASSMVKDEMNYTKNDDRPLITTTTATTFKGDIKKEVLKTIVPKKYNDKYYGLKTKNSKAMEYKSTKNDKVTEKISASTKSQLNEFDSTTLKYGNDDSDQIESEPSIDLTVIIKESNVNDLKLKTSNIVGNIPKIEIIQNDTTITEPEIKLENSKINNDEITQEISVKLPKSSVNNLTLDHEVIKITILKEDNSNETPTVLEVTTKVPVFDDENIKTTTSPPFQNSTDKTLKDTIIQNYSVKNNNTIADKILSETTPLPQTITSTLKLESTDNTITTQTEQPLITTRSTFTTMSSNDSIADIIHNIDANTTELPALQITNTVEQETELREDEYSPESNMTDTSVTIDDFQSPLLSGANEPPHRPNRSRRPQPANRINKFNPFRILG